MLDLIEYLTRWTRGGVLLVCLARDELLDRRPGRGGGRRSATTLTLDPLADDQARELVAALLPAGAGADAELALQVAERSGGNPLFAEEMVNRLSERGADDSEALPDTVHSVLAARLDGLPRAERRVLSPPRSWVDLLGGRLMRRRRDIDVSAALAGMQERDSRHHRRQPARRRARVRLQARVIRDVAYRTLPKAIRAQRHAEVAAYLAARAAEPLRRRHRHGRRPLRRALELGAGADLERTELERAMPAPSSARGGRRRFGGPVLQPRGAGSLREHADARSRARALARARIAEKLGDVALLLGRTVGRSKAGSRHGVPAPGGGSRAGRRPEPQDRRRPLAGGRPRGGDRALPAWHRPAQGGTAPHPELVRLYEEAATLYMHTGDNMLAIYAAEKALRLAERLDEAGAASRAHEVFGRVFGRMGDGAKARENLERSVELARSGPGPTTREIRALIALGSHLDMSESDYTGAAGAYSEARELARRGWRRDRRGQAPSPRSRCSPPIARTGTRSPRHTEASLGLAEREGLTREPGLPLRAARPAALAGRATRGGAEEAYRRALAIAEEDGLVRGHLLGPVRTRSRSARRGGDDAKGALDALDRALAVCERAVVRGRPGRSRPRPRAPG